MSSLLALAERGVPRYTSYPTTPYFSAAIGPNDYAAWLDALPPAATLSFYLHVPYCTHLCLYCGCHTRATRRRDPVTRYAARLMDEIALLGRATAARRVVRLHWGGGTPSILGAAQLDATVGTLARHFDLSSLDEHAIELDPRHVTPELAQALVHLGVNRASLGVQEFALHVQQAIGRIQPFERVRESVERLRTAGIERINFDLMYGLPHQTVADVRTTAALATSLRPQRLALFGYAHVPWFKPHQRLIDQASLPGAEERIEQARVAARTLCEHGYVPIGLDHFAQSDDDLVAAQRSGRLHRNFQGYTTDDAAALVGLGASAIGRLPQGFVQNAVDIFGHSRAVEQHRFATAKGIALSQEDRIRGRIIERLMCDLTVDLNAVGGSGRFAAEIDALRPLADEGVARIADGRITITEQGRPFARLAAAAFDAYLPQNRGRHSIAV